LRRLETLAAAGAVSGQALDDEQARLRGAEAALEAAEAQQAAAVAAVRAARSQVGSAEAAVQAAEATLARIEVDVAASTLTAPRAGRVQLRLVQPGEVVGAGARLLSLLDISDVYMSFFVPETLAGRVALGSEVRIVLDAAPNYVIPASVSFVASTAQFTPKTVETASERQKLMFRVRARIDPELLLRHREQVKTGLPGVAWLKLDPAAAWPASLALPPGL
jgi:HlyD family secretion protein